jgi:hypothetical protein
MSIILTGDVHSKILERLGDIEYQYPNLNKESFIIQLGDFGVIWNSLDSNRKTRWNEKNILKYIDRLPYNLLFLPGNHENMDRLFSDEFKDIEMFDSVVKQISDNVFMLKRGYIYKIDGKTIFTMGGGRSVDKEIRLMYNLGWWKEEMPSQEEYQIAIDNLNKVNNKVDLILTHEGPSHIIDILINRGQLMRLPPSPLEIFLENISQEVKFKKWYFGHYHMNYKYRNYRCLYEDIVKVK